MKHRSRASLERKCFKQTFDGREIGDVGRLRRKKVSVRFTRTGSRYLITRRSF
jgi:hypothetical protein